MSDIYGLNSPNSFYLDQARHSLPDGYLSPNVVRRATERLYAWVRKYGAI